ncbi:MAG: NADH-quinone oxidoreductase subunit C, partial [Terriglobia bacterium]
MIFVAHFAKGYFTFRVFRDALLMIANATILSDLAEKFGAESVAPQAAADEVPTFWTQREKISDVLRHLKTQVADPYKVFYDVTAIDERVRKHREGQPQSDFSVVYHLLSYGRNEYIRIKVALKEDDLHLPSVTGIWPCANWYEREVW